MFFHIQGLDDEYQVEGKLLGHYTYQEDGESLQTFPVMVTVEALHSLLEIKIYSTSVTVYWIFSPLLFQEQNDKAFQIIEVRVLSNWGHPEYTCMYRFRVHGEPRHQWTNHYDTRSYTTYHPICT